MKAVETIEKLIATRINVLNECLKNGYGEDFDRVRNQICGMMVCLKNLEGARGFYNVDYYDTYVEFGYYDKNHNWNVIA